MLKPGISLTNQIHTVQLGTNQRDISARCGKHLAKTKLKRVCKPPGGKKRQGTKIHSRIQQIFRGKGKDHYTEVRAPFGAKNPPHDPSVAVLKKKIFGKIDLLRVTCRGLRMVQVQIAEIKPLNVFGLGAGPLEASYYASKIRGASKAGDCCVNPQTTEDKDFCKDINASGQKVILKSPEGLLSWSPGRTFSMNLFGKPRRIIALSCFPGVTAYRCLGEETKKKKKKRKKRGKKAKIKKPPKGKVVKGLGKKLGTKLGKKVLKMVIPGAAYIELATIAVVIAAGGKPAFGAKGMSQEEVLVEIIKHGPPP